MSAPRWLVVRNDKLGDFMVSWPALALLRSSCPAAEIHALVARPVAELAAACPSIDVVHVDDGPLEGLSGVLPLARRLRALRLDAIVTLFSTTRTALAARMARIPYRLAPATKLAQLFYDHRLVQRRSRSEQPESAYNLDLARKLLTDQGQAPAQDPAPPFLAFDPRTTAERARALREAHGWPASSQLVFVHPGSGGSAPNLSPEGFAELGRALRSEHGHALVVTAGPNERALAERVAAGLGELPHAVFESNAGLVRFAELVSAADVFISGSTGVLHVAGALDRPTAGFYSRRRSACALRWQTLNSADRRLAFSPADDRPEGDMASIDLRAAAEEISRRFLRARRPARGAAS